MLWRDIDDYALTTFKKKEMQKKTVDALAQYIITQEQAGYSEGQIRQALSNQGYQKHEIDKAFSRAAEGASTVS